MIDELRALRLLLLRRKGGPGSGHRGHRGIPGHRGGSLPGSGGVAPPSAGAMAYLFREPNANIEVAPGVYQSAFMPESELPKPKEPVSKESLDEQKAKWAERAKVPLDEEGNPVLSSKIKIDYESINLDLDDEQKSAVFRDYRDDGDYEDEDGMHYDEVRYATPEDVDNALYNSVNIGLSELEDMYYVGDEYTSQVSVGHLVGDELGINVSWHDKNGNRVAHAERTYGYGECHNDYLKVEDNYQASGFAQKLYSNQMDVLERAGYERVTLNADITIGRYAWAKKGFDYAEGWKVEEAKEKLTNWLGDRDLLTDDIGDAIENNIYSAHDVATFDIGVQIRGMDIRNDAVRAGDSMHVGKAFMLDQSRDGHGDWNGVYYLQ